MGKTFTANAGYPPCAGETTPLTGEYTGNTPAQQADPGGFVERDRTTGSGSTFKIRIYGKVCNRSGNQDCMLFGPGGVDAAGAGLSCGRVHRWGYNATFAPAANCGPPKWPTGQLRDAYNRGDMRFRPYAEYCDFEVKAN